MSMESQQAQFVLPGRFSRMMTAMSSVTNTDSSEDVRQVQAQATEYALQWLPHFHRCARAGEKA